MERLSGSWDASLTTKERLQRARDALDSLLATYPPDQLMEIYAEKKTRQIMTAEVADDIPSSGVSI